MPHPRPYDKKFEKEIQKAIDSGNDPYEIKENYVAKHLDINWWNDHMNHIIYEETYRIMGNTIADFGCNHGLNTILLSRKANHATITGIDRSIQAIDVARKNSVEHNSENVNFVVHSLDNMSSIEDNYFTGGYMSDVIEHIYPTDREKILGEIRRTLRNNSHLIIITPYGKDDNIHHVDFFDELKIKNIFLECDWFELLYVQHDMRRNLRNKKQNRLNILLKIVKD